MHRLARDFDTNEILRSQKTHRKWGGEGICTYTSHCLTRVTCLFFGGFRVFFCCDSLFNLDESLFKVNDSLLKNIGFSRISEVRLKCARNCLRLVDFQRRLVAQSQRVVVQILADFGPKIGLFGVFQTSATTLMV